MADVVQGANLGLTFELNLLILDLNVSSTCEDQSTRMLEYTPDT